MRTAFYVGLAGLAAFLAYKWYVNRKSPPAGSVVTDGFLSAGAQTGPADNTLYQNRYRAPSPGATELAAQFNRNS